MYSPIQAIAAVNTYVRPYELGPNLFLDEPRSVTNGLAPLQGAAYGQRIKRAINVRGMTIHWESANWDKTGNYSYRLVVLQILDQPGDTATGLVANSPARFTSTPLTRHNLIIRPGGQAFVYGQGMLAPASCNADELIDYDTFFNDTSMHSPYKPRGKPSINPILTVFPANPANVDRPLFKKLYDVQFIHNTENHNGSFNFKRHDMIYQDFQNDVNSVPMIHGRLVLFCLKSQDEPVIAPVFTTAVNVSGFMTYTDA